jgi:hypothetical protein
MSSKTCKTELKEIENRKTAGLAADPTLLQKEITANCVIHRFIRRDHWDVENDRCLGPAFDDKRLSFYVERGDGFETISISQITDLLKEIREKNPNYVGAVKLTAEPFIGNNELKHDPYTVLDTGEKQHRNHGQAICEKTPLFSAELAAKAEWSIHPTSFLSNEE